MVLDAFLDRARPRNHRLGTIGVVSSALTAVLTAGPAVGGQEFASSVQGALGLPSSTAVWQGLCLLGLAISVVAAICTNLLRSQETAERISAAEQVGAELNGVQTLLELGRLDLASALEVYQKSLSRTPFIDEDLAPSKG
ncbi:hypothetical protein [Kribbella sp. NPDC051770]|uniref:hypothetical protein n=1 Tax=Kribbella sp. NPDC051770 TaxID=3155413 RepID=UPI0034297D0E